MQNTNTNESVSSIYIGDKCTLDLGAVGKGIACGVVQDYLKKQKEVSGAVIAVGGSILLYGSKADGSDWNVAVQNPKRTRWGSDGRPVPLRHNQRLHIRRLRKVFYAGWKKISSHP